MFGSKIRVFRTLLRMNQIEFGKKFDAYGSDVSKWENDQAEPKLSQVKKMVEHGLSPDFLLFGSGSPLNGSGHK